EAEKRAWISAFLAEHPCVDCGESDPEVLEFDHVGARKRQTSRPWFAGGMHLPGCKPRRRCATSAALTAIGASLGAENEWRWRPGWPKCPQCRRRESNPRRSRSENPIAPGHQSNDGMSTPYQC